MSKSFIKSGRLLYCEAERKDSNETHTGSCMPSPPPPHTLSNPYHHNVISRKKGLYGAALGCCFLLCISFSRFNATFDVPHINIINIITLLWNALREIPWEPLADEMRIRHVPLRWRLAKLKFISSWAVADCLSARVRGSAELCVPNIIECKLVNRLFFCKRFQRKETQKFPRKHN